MNSAGQWKVVQKKPKVKTAAPSAASSHSPRMRTAPKHLNPAQVTRFTPFITTMRKHTVDLEVKLPRVAGLYKKAWPKLTESFHTTMKAAVALQLVSRINIKADGGGSLRLLCDDWFPRANATPKSGTSRKPITPSPKRLGSSDRHIRFLKHALQKGLTPRNKGDLYKDLYQFFRPAAGEHVDDVLSSLAHLGVTSETEWWSRGAAERALADHASSRVSNRHVPFLRHALAMNLSTVSRSELNERLYQFFKPGGQDNLRDVWLRLEQLGVTTEDGNVWHEDAVRRAIEQLDGNGSIGGSVKTASNTRSILLRESNAPFMNVNIKMLQFMSTRAGGHLGRFPSERTVWNTWFDAWKLQGPVTDIKRTALLSNMSKLGVLKRKIDGELEWQHDVIRVYLGQAPMMSAHSFNVAYTSFLSFVLLNLSAFADMDELRLGIQVFLWKLQADTGNETDGQLSRILSQLNKDGVSSVLITSEFTWSLNAAATSLLTVALEVLGEDEPSVHVQETSVASPMTSSVGGASANNTETVSPATDWMHAPPITEQVADLAGLSINDHSSPTATWQEASTAEKWVGAGAVPTTTAHNMSSVSSSPRMVGLAVPEQPPISLPDFSSDEMFQMPMLTPQQRQRTANR